MTSATKATPPLSRCHTWIDETQWAYFQLNSPTSHTVCIEMTVAGRQRGGRGREWSGGDGRGGQGRVPDCFGGLSRVGISSRSTRPWNGQPPSITTILVMSTNTSNAKL